MTRSIAATVLPRVRALARTRFLLVVLLPAWASACGSSGGPTDSSPRLTVSQLTLTGTRSVIAGQTVLLTASAQMSDGSTRTVADSAVWETSSAATATVAGGVVRGVSPGTATITATYRGESADVAITVTPFVPVTPSVTAVTVTGPQFLVAGQTADFFLTAHLSNGTTRNATASAAWQTSNPEVATVSAAGTVTAVGAGSATITATYEERVGTRAVTIAAAPPPPSVRLLYLIPSDREFRPDYSAAIQNALNSVQSWYAGQLGGETFTLFASQPEVCRLPRTADYYAIDSWTKVVNDVQACAPVGYNSAEFTWVLYADVVHACNAPGRLGAGTSGLTIMPRQDMDGLIGAPYFDDCGVQYTQPATRYIGGAGHELGHALGLPHPPGCDAGAATCDHNALMWAGYAAYPNTYFRDQEKQFLKASPFIR